MILLGEKKTQMGETEQLTEQYMRGVEKFISNSYIRNREMPWPVWFSS